MKPISQLLASMCCAVCLSACGGISTNSETSQQSFETIQASEQAPQTSEEVETSPTVEEPLVEEFVTVINTEADNEPVTAPLDYERAITITKAASSIAKQGLVSTEVSTTHSLASFKTSQQEQESQRNGKFNVANFLSTLLPSSTTVTETISTITLNGECGGAAMTEGSRSYDEEIGFPYVIRANIIFDEYCTDISTVYTGATEYNLDGYSIIFNGDGSLVSEFPSDQEGHYEFDLIFSLQTEVSFLPPVVNINQWVSCSYFEGIENFDSALDCSTTLAYQGESESFTSNEFHVEGNNEIGYNVQVSLSDSSNEIYNASFNNLTVCENGNFGSGTSHLSYDQTEIDITFDNCSQASVDYNGTVIEVLF